MEQGTNPENPQKFFKIKELKGIVKEVPKIRKPSIMFNLSKDLFVYFMLWLLKKYSGKKNDIRYLEKYLTSGQKPSFRKCDLNNKNDIFYYCGVAVSVEAFIFEEELKSFLVEEDKEYAKKLLFEINPKTKDLSLVKSFLFKKNEEITYNEILHLIVILEDILDVKIMDLLVDLLDIPKNVNFLVKYLDENRYCLVILKEALRQIMSFKINRYDSSSDFIMKTIPILYPIGYTVVMNCWFTFNDEKFQADGISNWLSERLRNSILPANHPMRELFEDLEYGKCIIFHSDDKEDTVNVYEFFNDPDIFYVTFYENGKCTRENT